VDRSESIVPEPWDLASPLFDVFPRPRLAPFDREFAKLRELRQQEAARVERWPTAETTHPYRLVRGRHCVGDRDLDIGEVVAFNERQAAAFADLFEPVEDNAAT
jgi:hypothetical protein